jgi:hypothetical protein
LHQLALPSAMHEGSFFPTSSPIPVVDGVLMIATLTGVRFTQCDFDLYFLYGQRR